MKLPHWTRPGILLPLTLLAVLAACSPFAPSSDAVRASGLAVSEYPLVEQSADNPTHEGFEGWVQRAIGATRNDEAQLGTANQLLAPFGYQIGANPNAPFRAYALFRNGEAVQTNIRHFHLPKLTADQRDFTFEIETITGSRMTFNAAGLAESSREPAAQSRVTTGKLALAALPGAANSLLMTSDATTYQLNGKPVEFVIENGVSRLRYNGSDLPFTYDRIITDAQGEAAQFNPGSSAHVLWFYALRDGLWYYVEIGS